MPNPKALAQRTAAIDDADTRLLRFNHQALGDAVALEGDDVAGLQREHLLVATEAGAISELAVEPEADLLDDVEESVGIDVHQNGRAEDRDSRIAWVGPNREAGKERTVGLKDIELLANRLALRHGSSRVPDGLTVVLTQRQRRDYKFGRAVIVQIAGRQPARR